jgi:uncharacterized repeat protein (TIGR02543 family)
MKIKALKPFTLRDAETGELTSIACGAIAVVDDTLGASLIDDGLAEAYTLISPTGTVNITENGTVDVTQYASAVVNVGTYTVAFDANGGTGSLDSASTIAGGTVVLPDGTGLSYEGKDFVGWAESASGTEALTSPYKPTGNVTLYAIWEDIPGSESESESTSES